MSTSLSSQLAERDKTYNSKLEYVLAEQENLSGQQQQVLRDISAALAAQQALAASVSGAGGANGLPAGGSPSSAPAIPGLPLTPEQVRVWQAFIVRESVCTFGVLV